MTTSARMGRGPVVIPTPVDPSIKDVKNKLDPKQLAIDAGFVEPLEPLPGTVVKASQTLNEYQCTLNYEKPGQGRAPALNIAIHVIVDSSGKYVDSYAVTANELNSMLFSKNAKKLNDLLLFLNAPPEGPTSGEFVTTKIEPAGAGLWKVSLFSQLVRTTSGLIGTVIVNDRGLPQSKVK